MSHSQARTATHQYQNNPQLGVDHNGRGYCVCNRPQKHPFHMVPEVPDDVRAAEQRRTGDH